jgi:formamidopyrimidine-DNA glycosylase
MPELPEAETIVRGLRPHVTGRLIERVDVLRPDVLREDPAGFRRSLEGRRIGSVERRAKNIVAPLTSPEGAPEADETSDGRVLAVNLGMTGRLLYFFRPPEESRAPTHPAVRFLLDGDGVLVFDDVRRFGTVEALTAEAWKARSERMGPEPLDRTFTARALLDGLERSRSPVRSWLLDQRRVAGVGNIYANEALYHAGVDPRRPARDVAADEARSLHRALRRVLRNAIRAGGTTLRDYRTADGEEGRYGRALWVYGRDGEPCGRCGATIERVVFGGRSAFLCPGCQPGEGQVPGGAG